MNDQAWLAVAALGLMVVGNMVLAIWGAAKLSMTVKFMNEVLTTVVSEQKEIAQKLSDVDRRLHVVENRQEFQR